MKFSAIFFFAAAAFAGADAFVQKPAFSAIRASSMALSAVSKDDLMGCQKMIDDIILQKNCGPVLVR